jgi:hypothetical protein
MSKVPFVLLLAALAMSCSPDGTTPTPAVQPAHYPWAPQPGDRRTEPDTAQAFSSQLLIPIDATQPISLEIQGAIHPCTAVRATIGAPDPQNRISVEVYTVEDSSADYCSQVLSPPMGVFDITVPLGSFPAGHYTVEVNGQQVGEFDA